MKNLRVKIYGKVQGVFFRVFIKKEAEKIGLVGWIRNEKESTVIVEFEGEIDKLKELIRQCKKGSPASKVEKIDYEFSDELQGYNSFKILH